MKKILLISSLIPLLIIACGKKEEAPAPAAPAVVSGKDIFLGKGGCASCHGEMGLGNGPAGAALKPKPRNFTDAKWKNGDDLASAIKTITNGIPNTTMTSYKASLSEAEIKAVAEYVRELGKKK